jgi:GTP-binding protein HflX
VTDTVGFIRKLPHHLVASFRATLEEARSADILLHVVDASQHDWEEQSKVVDAVLADLGLHDRPTLFVFNKMDRVADPVSFGARVTELHPGAVLTNCVEPGGVEPLLNLLREHARRIRPAVRMVIPSTDGKRLAEVYRMGEVIDRQDTDEGVVLMVRMEEWQAKRMGA